MISGTAAGAAKPDAIGGVLRRSDRIPRPRDNLCDQQSNTPGTHYGPGRVDSLKVLAANLCSRFLVRLSR